MEQRDNYVITLNVESVKELDVWAKKINSSRSAIIRDAIIRHLQYLGKP